ncbi:hypothetical protein [uncultured Clostridium sp.]|uniref:hypothetical protein n=1 Tax=uncultured Clostridium sp. TaxID=59620 RepID=UPI002602804E|nr:hypothetical protein [uncultured Clostridium sp.]
MNWDKSGFSLATAIKRLVRSEFEKLVSEVAESSDRDRFISFGINFFAKLHSVKVEGEFNGVTWT